MYLILSMRFSLWIKNLLFFFELVLYNLRYVPRSTTLFFTITHYGSGNCGLECFPTPNVVHLEPLLCTLEASEKTLAFERKFGALG